MWKKLLLAALLAINSFAQITFLPPTTGGAVGGASSLSTPGAVPYVVSTGVLGQAPTGLFYDAANVRLGVGTGTPLGKVSIAGDVSSQPTTGSYGQLEIVGATSSAKRLALGYNTTGNVGFIQALINAALFSPLTLNSSGGNVLVGGPLDGNYKLDVQVSGSTGTLRAFNQAVGGSTLVVVQAGDTQSGNLLSVRNNAGLELASISAFGNVTSVGGIIAGAGGYIQMNGRALFRSPSDGVLGMYNNAETDFNRLQFGGTTSSFPALKRSSATLQVRLADDSAFATLDMGIPKFSGTNSTGAGSALLGTNSPASTLTAPYTWITVVTADGSTAYIPAWK